MKRTRASLVVTFVATSAIITLPQALNPESPFYDYRTASPGTRHRITLADLPPPYTAPVSWEFRPALPTEWPLVPEGFTVDKYVTGLDNPRVLRRAPNGDVFIAESKPGRIRVLREADAGTPPLLQTFAADLKLPFGIAFFPLGAEPEFVYVANTDSVVRYPYENGDLQARGPAEVVVPHLPADGHWTRDLAFSLDERSLFISVGSGSNVTDIDNNSGETNRANILETTPEGGALRVYASGLRNPSGLAVDPDSGELWTTVNERDLMGNNLPPDYVTSVRRDGFYGWPWFYIGGNPDPTLGGKHPELKFQVIVPDVLLQPHSAPIGLTFYDGAQFPEEYRGDIFVASHGAWNRTVLTGYEVLRVRRINGRPTGEYEDFMTGFVSDSSPEGAVRGQPAGIAVAADGSLLISDDVAVGPGVIWRIRTKAAAESSAVGRRAARH
jgi:glucose/arabinose dehydrogenase